MLVIHRIFHLSPVSGIYIIMCNIKDICKTNDIKVLPVAGHAAGDRGAGGIVGQEFVLPGGVERRAGAVQGALRQQDPA